MGRVRRYKKWKSVDPFSSRKPPGDDDAPRHGRKRKRQEANLPPDEVNHGRRLSDSQRQKREQAFLDFSMGTADYVEELERRMAQKSKKEEMKLKVTPRGERESLKSFERRVDHAKGKALRQRKVAESATKRKKRAFLRQKKAMAKGKMSKEEVLMDGVGDPEDEFRTKSTSEELSFIADGETVEAPPDLGAFTKKLRKAPKKVVKSSKAKGKLKADIVALREEVITQYRRQKAILQERKGR